jgi:hypothetical protein
MVLGRLPQTTNRLTTAAPGRFAPFRPGGLFYGTHCLFHDSSHGTVLKLPGGATSSFFSAIDGIAEHLCDRGGAAKEMDLEAMGLFFCPRFGINASDI